MKKKRNDLGIHQSISAIFADEQGKDRQLVSLQIKKDGKLKLVVNKRLLEENNIELEEER